MQIRCFFRLWLIFGCILESLYFVLIVGTRINYSFFPFAELSGWDLDLDISLRRPILIIFLLIGSIHVAVLTQDLRQRNIIFNIVVFTCSIVSHNVLIALRWRSLLFLHFECSFRFFFVHGRLRLHNIIFSKQFSVLVGFQFIFYFVTLKVESRVYLFAIHLQLIEVEVDFL